MAQSLNITGSCNGSLSIFEVYGGDKKFFAYFTVSTTLERVLIPIWIILGVPGAIISLIVWLHRRMRFSSSVYLIALGFVDLVFLLSQIVWYLDNVSGIPIVNLPIICSLYPSLTYALQYASPLLTLGFTVERYISVCFPFRHETMCTTRRAVWVTAGLLFLSFLSGGVQAFVFYFDGKSCGLNPQLNVEGGIQRLWLVWTWTSELLIFGLVPCTILAINVRVIIEMKRVAQRVPVSIGNGDTGGSGTRNTRATTVMMLSVSFYLIAATLPVTICYVLSNLLEQQTVYCITKEEFEVNHVWKVYLVIGNVRAVIDAFARSHYAAKFYIYMVTGKQFRRQFSVMFCPQRFQRPFRPTTSDASVSYTPGIPMAGAHRNNRRAAANGRRMM